MKLEKFKRRYRITIVPPGNRWKWNGKSRSKVYDWCLDRFGLTEDERWVAREFRTWSVSYHGHSGLYVYFKNESDAVMFLLGFPIKDFT